MNQWVAWIAEWIAERFDYCRQQAAVGPPRLPPGGVDDPRAAAAWLDERAVEAGQWWAEQQGR